MFESIADIISVITMWALLCDNDLKEGEGGNLQSMALKSSLFETGRSLCDQNKDRG